MSADDYPDSADRQYRNAERFVRDTERLRLTDATYEVHGGHHYIVSSPNGTAWDYWPSTGKYHQRTKGAKYLTGGLAALVRDAGLSLIYEPSTSPNGAMREPSAVDKLNEHVIANAPLVIMWAKHMSRFAVWSYEQAGFIVLGTPS